MMYEILKRRISQLSGLSSDAAKSNAAIALYRIIMQHAMIALFEWCVMRIERYAARPPGIELPISEIRKPTDGGMITALAELLVAAENLGWKGISSRWWGRISSTSPSVRLILDAPRNVDGLLTSYVQRRNDGLGHGIPGNYDPEAEIDMLYILINCLFDVLPKYYPSSNQLMISGAGETCELKFLRLINYDPILIRSMKLIGAGKVRIKFQILRPNFEPEPSIFETDDIAGRVPAIEIQGLAFSSTHDESWNPLGVVPERNTLEFTGRHNEFSKLKDWFDDQGSRACLIYGDGGVGKTTLLIEFIHRLMEGKIDHEWKPEAIFYYTAKQTQWTVDGLRFIGVPRVGLSDALRSIIKDIEGLLSREWYGLSIASLSSKVEDFLREFGIERASTLLVIDNAETLAKNEAQVDELAEESECNCSQSWTNNSYI